MTDTETPLSPGRAFEKALRGGDVETVRRIAAEHPGVVGKTSRPLGTWLHMAARYPNTAMLRALLELGVDRHHVVQGKTSRNALATAAPAGLVDNVRLLHEAGVEIDTRDQNVDPPWCACHAHVRPGFRPGSGPVAHTCSTQASRSCATPPRCAPARSSSR